jgi:hypothetical protein
MVYKELLIAMVQLNERNIYHNNINPANICYILDDYQLNIFIVDIDSISF